MMLVHWSVLNLFHLLISFRLLAEQNLTHSILFITNQFLVLASAMHVTGERLLPEIQYLEFSIHKRQSFRLFFICTAYFCRFCFNLSGISIIPQFAYMITLIGNFHAYCFQAPAPASVSSSSSL